MIYIRSRWYFPTFNPGTAILDNDVLLVLYDNGTNSYLATVETSGGIATNGTAAANHKCGHFPHIYGCK